MRITVLEKTGPFAAPAALSKAFASFVIVLFLISGCAAGKPSKPGYFETLNRWTRAKKVFEGLETRLYIYATYKTDEFRTAYTDEYSARFQLEDSYKEVLMEREKELSERYNEFFISASTPDERWNDFDRRNSIWKLYLEDASGARLVPMEVRKVDSSDPLFREFFPYMDPWSSGYIVRFPKYSEEGKEIPGKDARTLRLVVTGVMGKGELEWGL